MTTQKTSAAPLTLDIEEARNRIASLESMQIELQKVKEDLRKSEEQYRTAFQSTGTAMMVVEEDTTVSMWNSRLEEVTGYTEDYAYTGRKWTEFVHEEDLERLRQFHISRRQNSASVPNEYEFRLKHASGQIRDILMNVGLIPGTKKSLISLVDITQRKRMENALRESERSYRDLFENANDVIYTIDLDGKFTSVNKTAESIYGYRREEIIGKDISSIVDPHFVHIARRHIRHKAESVGEQTAPYELLTRTRNGDPVWVEVGTRLMQTDGRPVGIQGIARNISERKKAETELSDSERRFRETAETIPGIICEMDMHMKLTYVNSLGLATFGYTQKDFEAGINGIDVLPPDEHAHARRDFANVVAGDFGKPEEYRMLKYDGSIIHTLINSSPIVKDGAVCGMRSCCVDITDRKKAEEMVRQSEEKFRSIFEHSPVGVALCTDAGALVEMNGSFAAMFGIDPRQSEKTVLTALADDAGRMLAKARAHGKVAFESEGKAAAGGQRFFNWCITSPGADTGIPAALLVQVQDITERKTAEEQKLRSVKDEAEKAHRMVAGLRKELMQNARFHNMISRSPAMKSVFDILPEIAQSPATVLISGESGTGKELIARSLHELGQRKTKPFVAINCSALPDNLLESELFGYKAGAFTDAKKDKPGKFALAEGGTIFLDEIGDISSAMQVKLLRVLQERTYEPLGGTAPVKADVRVVAATNKNLSEMVKKGEFREDLFYRIKVLMIKLPPLAERRCDIPLLCDHFIGIFNARYRKNISAISESALTVLLAHSFPGNIRELENVIEHAFIFCKGTTIESEHLPAELKAELESREIAKTVSGIKNFDELEKAYIQSILVDTGGNKLLAAKRLGVHKATLFRKLKKLGIQ
jgi:PAS domain S-box-containing protein